MTNFTVGASGTFTIYCGGLPSAGLSVRRARCRASNVNQLDGVLSGTPTMGGMFPIVITAHNAWAQTPRKVSR